MTPLASFQYWTDQKILCFCKNKKRRGEENANTAETRNMLYHVILLRALSTKTADFRPTGVCTPPSFCTLLYYTTQHYFWLILRLPVAVGYTQKHLLLGQPNQHLQSNYIIYKTNMVKSLLFSSFACWYCMKQRNSILHSLSHLKDIIRLRAYLRILFNNIHSYILDWN